LEHGGAFIKERLYLALGRPLYYDEDAYR